MTACVSTRNTLPQRGERTPQVLYHKKPHPEMSILDFREGFAAPLSEVCNTAEQVTNLGDVRWTKVHRLSHQAGPETPWSSGVAVVPLLWED